MSKNFPYQIKYMLYYLLSILILSLINSCGLGVGSDNGGGSVNPLNTKTLVSVQVSASSTQLIPLGSSVQFTATAVYSDNTSQDVTSIASWSSANASVAMVNTSGFVQAVGLGSTDIQASYQDDWGSSSGSATVTVSNSKLASVAISPANIDIPLKIYQRLTLTGVFTDGSTVDLTLDPNTTWSSSDSTVASVYESADLLNFPNGLVLAVGESLNATTINVSYTDSQGTVFNSTSPITVNSATIESISIVGDNTMVLGESEMLYAEGHFRDGSNHTLNGLESAIWLSSKPSVIKIESHTGLATATTDITHIAENSIITISYEDASGNVATSAMPVSLVQPGAAWSGEIDSGYIAKNYALAVDSNDNPILLFVDNNPPNAARVVTYVSGNWKAADPQSSTGQISKGTSGWPALTVDHLGSHDILYAFYSDNTSNNHITAQKLDTANPTWSVLQSDIDNHDAKASMSSLTAALDKAHTPFIGFHEHGEMGGPDLAVMHWVKGDNAFKKYGTHYADGDGSNATSLGLAINSLTDVTLGFLRGGSTNGYVYITHNADNNHWQEATISPVSTNVFASTAGFYTESKIYMTYEQPASDGSYTLINLVLASGDNKHTLTYFSLNTTKLFAQTNLAIGEGDTDKPVIAYIDASGNVAIRYYVYATNLGLTSFLGANPVVIAANANAYNNPKVVIGKNIAWVAYQDSNKQIILKKLVNPFNK